MLNIEEKIDSPEKLAAVAGKPTENYLFAPEFNQVVAAVNSLSANSAFSKFITYIPPIVSTGQLVAPVDQEWEINAVNYTNTGAVTIPISLSSSGLKRFDEFYATTGNTFVRVPGSESANPEFPNENPAHGLRYAVLLVTDSAIGTPTEPATGGNFKTKSENGDAVYSLGPFEYISATEASYCRIQNQTTGFLKAIRTYIGNTNLYPGKEYTVKNETGAALTLKHQDTSLTGTDYKKFWFSEGFDLTLQNGESAEFHYSSGRFELKGTNKNTSDAFHKVIRFIRMAGGLFSGSYINNPVFTDRYISNDYNYSDIITSTAVFDYKIIFDKKVKVSSFLLYGGQFTSDNIKTCHIHAITNPAYVIDGAHDTVLTNFPKIFNNFDGTDPVFPTPTAADIGYYLSNKAMLTHQIQTPVECYGIRIIAKSNFGATARYAMTKILFS